MRKAAIYCRSSKDRAEVGLETQRRELKAYAKREGLDIVEEFSDMELSGSGDETTRPGLREMLAGVRSPSRKWELLLALDTSRIARDPMIGLYVTRECEKHGVDVRYAKMPVDGSSAFGETMLSVIRSFDRLHARLSAEKGRGGLESNIAKGYRAGGRAPFGYKLKHESTGATRGGQEVKKSKLVLDEATSSKVRQFLQLRVSALPRYEAAKSAGLESKAVASLIAIERNALTYAGYTVWNQRKKHRPSREDERKTMLWRPRSEWIISDERTHPAMIDREQAEKLIAAFEVPSRQKARARNPEQFLLSGLMFTPNDVQWHGDGHDKAYRAGSKGKRVSAPWIESAVLERIADDFEDEDFLARVVNEAQNMADGIEVDPKVTDAKIRSLEKKLKNLVDLGAETGDRAILTRMREVQAELDTLRDEAASQQERMVLKKRLSEVKKADVRFMLSCNAGDVRNAVMLEEGTGKSMIYLLYDDSVVEQYTMKREALRKVLTSTVSRVVLDPKTREFKIRYRLPVPAPTGARVASPRGFEPRLPP